MEFRSRSLFYLCWSTFLPILESRELIGTIRESSVLSSIVRKLKSEHNENQDNQIKRSLILDVRTRWNSTYKMLESLNIHRPIIMEIFQRKTSLGITRRQQHRLTSLELTSDCWYTIELLIKVLKPFYAATKAISGSQYPTIGITFYIFRRLEKDFLSSIVPDDDSLFNNMKACLLDRMNDYQMVQDPLQAKTITVSLFVQYALFFRRKTEFLSV